MQTAKKIIEWIKGNGVVVLLLCLLIFVGNGYLKESKVAIQKIGENITLQESIKEVTTRFDEYKTKYNSDYEWVSEPVFKADGNLALDGGGNAVYRKRLVKKIDYEGSRTQAVTVVNTVAVTQTHAVTIYTHDEEKKEKGKIPRFCATAGGSLNGSSRVVQSLIFGGTVRVLRGLGAGVNVVTPTPFLDSASKETTVYLHSSLFF